MITKFPNAISSGKILTLILSFLAKTYESHTQFYTPPLVYSGITMYKEYETKRSYRPVRLPLTTCTSPLTITRIVNTHFGRWSRLVDVYSSHRWSNEEIETHFARDGGIAPVDVLFNTGDVIRWWHANRKWLLCDVYDKSCSNTRHATILPLNHQRFYR